MHSYELVIHVLSSYSYCILEIRPVCDTAETNNGGHRRYKRGISNRGQTRMEPDCVRVEDIPEM